MNATFANPLEWLNDLELPGGKIEPQDGVSIDLVGPYLAVDIRVARHDHGLLHGIAIQSWRDGKNLELLLLGVELRNAGLKHHREPEIAVLVRFHVERARRKSRF